MEADGSLPRILVIGAGGLGCAAALALGRSTTPLAITFVDPDHVERSNLHRQVLYDDGDLGRPKAERAAERVQRDAARRGIRREARALVQAFDVASAMELVAAHDLVIEGTDRHQAKFLAADVGVLSGVPVVHAGFVGWSGWAMATRPRRTACLRCVFEEIPDDAEVATCAGSGVVGPAVGAMGALEATLAMHLVERPEEAGGSLHRFDALLGTARTSRVSRRSNCALCGDTPTILALDGHRYGETLCATRLG